MLFVISLVLMKLQDAARDVDELCMGLSSFEKNVLLEINLFYDLNEEEK